MLDFIRQSDVVITESISRIGRVNSQVLSVISCITDKGAEFVSLKENIDTTTPQGQFMLSVFGAMAQLERENLLQRQKEGIAIAKTDGKYKGRKPIKIDEVKFKDVVHKWRQGNITAVQAMRELGGLKPNTFYRRVKELNL